MLPTYFISHGGGPWPWLDGPVRRNFDVLEASLRDAGVLLLASGLSYHNLRQFGPGAQAASKAFDAWLTETLVRSSPGERVERLQQWMRAPSARQAHPQEDHLIPLMVAVGAAEDE